MSGNYAFEPGSIRVLDLLGIVIPDPTKQDCDVAAELRKMVRCVYNYVPDTFKDNMRQRRDGKRSKQNKLAALLVAIPDERFLEANLQLVYALKSESPAFGCAEK